jgi:hypothetical protein
MTLIVTNISRLGILQASDSNLTNDRTGHVAEGRKVFPLGFCSGALALAGSYQVADQSMDVWMPAAIADYIISANPSLEGFARYLKSRLDNEADANTGLLLHIAGYAGNDNDVHPEMWFVRNYSQIDEEDGSYKGRTDEFLISVRIPSHSVHPFRSNPYTDSDVFVHPLRRLS